MPMQPSRRSFTKKPTTKKSPLGSNKLLKAKPKARLVPFMADGKPKMGKKSFTKKQQIELASNSYNVYMKELGKPEKNMFHALTQELIDNPYFGVGREHKQLTEKLTKKMKNGTYDGNEAEKLAVKLFDDTSKWRFYALGDKPKNEDISPKVKKLVAKYWARDFESGYADGSFDESIDPNTGLKYD